MEWAFNPGAVLELKKDLKFEKKDPTGKDLYLSAFIVLRCSNQMIDEKAPFCIWGDNTKFIHTFFRCALHITLITNPCGTPTFKVDSEREDDILKPN